MRNPRLVVPLILVLTTCTTKIGSRDSSSPADLIATVEKQISRGDWDQAVATAGLALESACREPDTECNCRFRVLKARAYISKNSPKAALPLIESAFPEEFPDLDLKRQIQLAKALRKTGRSDSAANILEAALPKVERLGLLADLIEGEVTLGSALFDQKQWDRGERVLRRALSRSHGVDARPFRATSLNNLAVVCIQSERWDEAVRFLDEARTIQESQDAEEDLARTLNNLGIALNMVGDFEGAIGALERTIEIRTRKQVPTVHRPHGELGGVFVLKGDLARGVERYQVALDLAQKRGDVSDAARYASNLSVAYIMDGQWDRAEQMNDLSAAFRQKTGDAPQLVYTALNAGDIALGRGDHARAESKYEEVVRLSAERPALMWGGLAGLGKLRSAQGRYPDANRHFEKALGVIDGARASLSRQEHRITFLARLIGFYDDYVSALVNQGRSDQALLTADSSRSRVLAERTTSSKAQAVPTIDALRRLAARESAALVSFWITDKRSLLWVVTPRTTRFVPLPPKREIEQMVTAHNSAILGLRDPLRTGREASTRLHATLLAPLRELVPKGSRVILVPDGPLHGLNFETIPVPDPSPHYWIEDVVLTVAPSFGILMRENAPVRSKRDSLLMIGAPLQAVAEFPALPNAEPEIHRIEEHFRGASTSVFTGEGAHAGAYKAAGPERFALIHFAAHATANPVSPLDSAVILSPKDGGYKLYAREIARAPISAEVVTLSACRGAGARSYAGEGLMGFAWAFLQSGARNVVAGLWDVGDESTARLMDDFYQHLSRGESVDVSLRKAKLALLTGTGGEAKPFYWGPFQVYSRAL